MLNKVKKVSLSFPEEDFSPTYNQHHQRISCILRIGGDQRIVRRVGGIVTVTIALKPYRSWHFITNTVNSRYTQRDEPKQRLRAKETRQNQEITNIP